jgi:hypothetical protein
MRRRRQHCKVWSARDMERIISTDLQGSQAKRSRDTDFLSFRQCEAPNRWDGHDEDDKIREDRGCCVCNPCRDLIDAFAGNIGVPHLLDRHADEDEDEGDGDNPDHHKRSDSPCHLLEVGQSEDAVVHQKNADLRPAEVERVQDLCHDEPFGHHHDVCWIKEVCVDTHATHMHGEDKAHDREVPSLRSVSDSSSYFSIVTRIRTIENRIM